MCPFWLYGVTCSISVTFSSAQLVTMRAKNGQTCTALGQGFKVPAGLPPHTLQCAGAVKQSKPVASLQQTLKGSSGCPALVLCLQALAQRPDLLTYHLIEPLHPLEIRQVGPSGQAHLHMAGAMQATRRPASPNGLASTLLGRRRAGPPWNTNTDQLQRSSGMEALCRNNISEQHQPFLLAACTPPQARP
jgi:hypothetical protein